MPDQASTDAALPDEWAAMLDAIDARLHEAITLADARAASFDAPTHEGGDRRSELGALERQCAGLQDRSARIATLASDCDAALAAAEDVLRPRLPAAEALRERLSAWAGRAIR